MENCIFCKIIKKEIDSNIVFEDENYLCILDITQTTLGHTLVIPKIHSNNVLEMKDINLIQIIQKVSEILKNKFNYKGLNILSNINEVAGQTVMHTHFHLIPRYGNDNIQIKFSENQELLNTAKKII